MKFKSVIFDIDGVLVDVSQSYRQAIQKTVEDFTGFYPTPEEIQKYKERGGLNNDWDLSEAIILDKGKKVPKQEIIDKFQEYYLGKNWDGFITKEKLLLPKSCIESLAKKYKLGILTGRPRAEAEFILKYFQIFDLFEIIVAMEDTGDKPKPNPFGLNLALKKLKIPSCYFGDSIDDMKAAVSAQMTGIGVIPPTVKNNTLKERLYLGGAKTVIDTVVDSEKAVSKLESELV
ncbi:MAG: TIGR01548 family HAD-type hydrolase [archaeon]|jgi:HAD superfamily phosphatase